MTKINSIRSLLMEELAELLNAENQLAQALPKLAKASQSSALKIILEDHLEVTKDQADRLNDIFSNIGQIPPRVTCRTIKELMEEGDYIIKELEECPVRDSAIISVVQQVEKYEITRYLMASEHAADLGHTRIVELLGETLKEERAMNLCLNELAQFMINVQAIDPPPRSKEGGFYMPKEKFGKRGTKVKVKSTGVSRFLSEGDLS